MSGSVNGREIWSGRGGDDIDILVVYLSSGLYKTQKCIGLFVVSPAWVVDNVGEDIHLGMYVHPKLIDL